MHKTMMATVLLNKLFIDVEYHASWKSQLGVYIIKNHHQLNYSSIIEPCDDDVERFVEYANALVQAHNMEQLLMVLRHLRRYNLEPFYIITLIYNLKLPETTYSMIGCSNRMH